MPGSIAKDMKLTAFDPLPSVIATIAFVFIDWLSTMPAVGLSFRPALSRATMTGQSG